MSQLEGKQRIQSLMWKFVRLAPLLILVVFALCLSLVTWQYEYYSLHSTKLPGRQVQQVSAKVPAQSNTYYREEGPLNILKENIEMLHAESAPAQTCKTGSSSESKQPDANLKKILFWNSYRLNKQFYFGLGQKPFISRKCKFSNCITTEDRNLFKTEEIDAIVWNLREHTDALPKIRNPRTYYVLFMTERPHGVKTDFVGFNDAFNWTMTYRTDSDFPFTFGGYEPKTINPVEPAASNNIKAANKTKFAAWFVSNCDSDGKREVLVSNLQQHFPIDIYGRCGPLKCPKANASECYEMIERDYKFYLSFENGLCVDYVTEKLWNVLKLNIVPIVYGLGYENRQLPPYSYIDVLDFPSVNELIDYLDYLNNNDTAYQEYFRWKDSYEFVKNPNHHFCQLCERLHLVSDLQNHMDPKHFQTKKLILPPHKRSGIELPNPNLDGIVEENGWQKRYLSIKDWFMTGSCVVPEDNSTLNKFIHGMLNS